MATISQRISLEGSEEIRQQLLALGQAGEQAFKQIQVAAAQPIVDPAQFEKTEQALTGLAAAGSQLGAQFNELADASGTAGAAASDAAEKTKAAFSGISAETIKTGAEIAKLGAEIAKIGVEIGLAVTRHQSWVRQLIHLGSAASTATRALGLVAPELAAVGLAVTGGVIAFGTLEAAVTKFAAADEKANASLQQLATTSRESFQSLQEGQAAFAQIGIKAETFSGVVTKLADDLGNLDVSTELLKAQKALLEAQAARAAAGGQAAPAGAEAQLQALDEQLTKTKQLADANAALANNLQNLLPIIARIAAGQKDITFDPLVTAEGKIAAVTVLLKQVQNAGGNAAKALLEFVASADKMTAIQVGAAFGLSNTDVDRLRRYGAELGTVDALYKRIQAGGVLISPAAAASFDKMADSVQRVDSAWARLEQAWKSTVFSALAAEISAGLNSIKATAVETAAKVLESLNQLAADALSVFGKIIEGYRILLTQIRESSIGQAIGETLQNSVSGLNQIVAGLVGGVMQGMQAFTPEQITAVKNEILGLKQASTDAATEVQELGLTGQQAAQQLTGGLRQGASAADIFRQNLEALYAASGVPMPDPLVAANEGATKLTQNVETLQATLGQAATTPVGQKLAAGLQAADAAAARVHRTLRAMAQEVGITIPPIPDPFVEVSAGATKLAQDVAAVAPSLDEVSKKWEELTRVAQAANFPVTKLLQLLPAGASNSVSALQGVIDSLNGIMRAAQAAEGAVAEMNGVLVDASGPGFGTPGVGHMARGGLLGGRGTGTSDSNLAWLSRGEYITPARAVRQPGVLAFLEALRRSGGNLRGILDDMGHFARGGLVLPALAAGGLNGGTSNVTIQFPGVPPIGGLRASSEVVGELQKAAALAQVRSGGRKPSRYS